jgi:hypothetical protein
VRSVAVATELGKVKTTSTDDADTTQRAGLCVRLAQRNSQPQATAAAVLVAHAADGRWGARGGDAGDGLGPQSQRAESEGCGQRLLMVVHAMLMDAGG